ncbi:MAG: histidinol dehydrogenase, partial [Bacteroidota bacterium]
MKIYNNPNRKDWPKILARPTFEQASLEEKVSGILKDIKTFGDVAVKRFTAQFDKVDLDNAKVSSAELEAAIATVPEDLKQAIQQAKNNIEAFHTSQREPVQVVETMPGVKCWRKSVGIDKVGLYIPGGPAPLFSTILMLGVPAKLAGCQEIVLCTPPSKDGTVNPAILYTANLVGVTQIFKIGGVQAVGAMAYGTGTVPKVYKIFGPGNQYVTAAKQVVQRDGTAIDMPAGPSEVMVVADGSANPAFVAADLLSQAEHGVDSSVVLVVTNETLLKSIQRELDIQLAALPRREFAAKALENSCAIINDNVFDVVDIINEYAPEHLILSMESAAGVANDITNAGSVFIGHYSPESVGDYASGTNHTLPT